SEMLAIARGSVYIERTAVNSPKNVRNTKRALEKAFKVQLVDLGFSLVEILSQCPTNWKMTPQDSLKHIDNVVTKFYPLKVIKDETGF
ncbi:MAG: 2-oxoglutarate oxidoreductase, partial [Desulfatiglandales bacterium]